MFSLFCCCSAIGIFGERQDGIHEVKSILCVYLAPALSNVRHVFAYLATIGRDLIPIRTYPIP